MNTSDYLGKIITIRIDRPMGSKHPKHSFIYPVNYGFVPNTKSADGEELDAYLLGVFEPVEEYTGRCIAYIKRLDDDDDKLIIVPKDKSYYPDQIDSLVEFQERFFSYKIKCDSDALYNIALPHPYMLERIIEDIIEADAFSASRIQVKFSMNHGFVARVANLFYALGIIGPQNGNKPRELLIKNHDEILKKIDDFKNEKIA